MITRTTGTRAPAPRVVVALAAVLILAGLAFMRPLDVADAADAADAVQWVPFNEAEALARATGKPILYDFTAEWCPPCHQLEDAVFRDARLAAMINDRFVPVRITDRMREEGANPPLVDALQRRYAVNGFPTVIVADASGIARARLEGFGGAEAFEEMMERFR